MDSNQQGKPGQSSTSENASSSTSSSLPNFLMDLSYSSFDQNAKLDSSLTDYPPELRQMMQMQLPNETPSTSNSLTTPVTLSNLGSSSFIQPSVLTPNRLQQIAPTSQPGFNLYRNIGERSNLDIAMLQRQSSFQPPMSTMPAGFNFQPFKTQLGMPSSTQMAYPGIMHNNRPIMNRNESISSLFSHSGNNSGQQFPTSSQGSLSGTSSSLNNQASSLGAQAARARPRPNRPARQPSVLKSPAPPGVGGPAGQRPRIENLPAILSQLTPETQRLFSELITRGKTKPFTMEEFSRILEPHLGDKLPLIMQALTAQQPANQPSPNPTNMTPRVANWSGPQNIAAKTQTPGETAPPQTPPAARPVPTSSESKSSDSQATDFGLLTDVMGSVGVDLKEESENILRGVHGSSSNRQSGLNPSEGGENVFTAPEPLLDQATLRTTLMEMASEHDMQEINGEVYGYISLAVEERLRELVEQMIKASVQRTRSLVNFPNPPSTESGRPLYRIATTLDPKKQLQALERVDRNNARSFQLRLEEGSQLDEDGEPRVKRNKTRKDPGSGPSSSVRNLSEDARKRNANQTTHMFTGGHRKSWMMASVSTTPRVSSPLASTPPTTPAAEKPAAKTPPPSAPHVRHLPATSSNLVPKPTTPSSPSSPVISSEPNPGLFQKPPHPTLLNLPARSAKPASPASRNTQVRSTSSRSISAQDALFVLEADQAGRPCSSRSRLLIKMYTNRQ